MVLMIRERPDHVNACYSYRINMKMFFKAIDKVENR